MVAPLAIQPAPSGGTGDIDFGLDAAYPMLEMQRTWFQHYLVDGGTALPVPKVRLFVMGENRWRDEDEWPLARTRYDSLYLSSDGAANTASGTGALVKVAPRSDQPFDTYRYDPADPVPSAGGR